MKNTPIKSLKQREMIISDQILQTCILSHRLINRTIAGRRATAGQALAVVVAIVPLLVAD
jgi:hypothetical protein